MTKYEALRLNRGDVLCLYINKRPDCFVAFDRFEQDAYGDTIVRCIVHNRSPFSIVQYISLDIIRFVAASINDMCPGCIAEPACKKVDHIATCFYCMIDGVLKMEDIANDI